MESLLLVRALLLVAAVVSLQLHRTSAEWRKRLEADVTNFAKSRSLYETAGRLPRLESLRGWNSALTRKGELPPEGNDEEGDISGYVLPMDGDILASNFDLSGYVDSFDESPEATAKNSVIEENDGDADGADDDGRRWSTAAAATDRRKRNAASDSSILNLDKLTFRGGSRRTLEQRSLKALMEMQSAGTSKTDNRSAADAPFAAGGIKDSRQHMRSKRRTQAPQLQEMLMYGSVLDSKGGIRNYGSLKRVPGSTYQVPAKSRVAAGMRYAGIGKRKVNVRSRVDAGMRYMGIGKREY